MPIAGKKKSQPEEVIKPAPILVEDRHTAIVKNVEMPSEFLLTHVEGMAWVVNYFSQILGTEEEPTPLQLKGLPIYQQYRNIKDMELRVTSALSTTQDQATGEFSVEGTAHLYPSFIPNSGDMFFADIGNGFSGVFTLTSQTRMSIYKEACYEINYRLTVYLSQDIEDAVEERVVETLYFEKSRFIHDGNPFLTDTKQKTIGDLKEQYNTLMDNYLDMFMDYTLSTPLVPTAQDKLYDHYVTEVLYKTLPTDTLPLSKRIKIMNCGQAFNDLKYPTIWDALLERKDLNDYRLLKVMCEEYSVRNLAYDPAYSTIRYMGVDNIIYPSKQTISPYDPAQENSDVTPNIPDINSLGNWYVFTEHFYNGNKKMCSKLELLVFQYLDDEVVDLNVLHELCLDTKNWNDLSYFYYVPVLMILLITQVMESH